MTIDDERGWIVLSSVKGGAGGKHLGTTSPDILRSLLVLSTGTLEPVAHLQICRSIFGSDIFDAELVSWSFSPLLTWCRCRGCCWS